MRYNKNMVYIEECKEGTRILRKCTTRKTFDWVNTWEGLCDVYDIPTFKSAVIGRKVKAVNLKTNTITDIYLKGTKFEDEE